MSFSLNTAANAPAGVTVPAITALEASALEVPGLVARFSARDIDVTARGLAYRDGCSSLLWRADAAVRHGVSAGTTRPAARFNADPAAMLSAPFQLPASYSVYALVVPNTDKTFNAIFGHTISNGNRVLLTADVGRHLRLAQGGDEIATTGAYAAATAYVGFWSFDLATTTGAIAVNSATSLVTGAMTAHSGAKGASIGGVLVAGVGTHNMNGYIEEVWVFEGGHGVAGMQAERLAIMTALAEQGGVSLS